MSSTHQFTVELYPEPEGAFTVRVPALPEVVTYGMTREEALTNATEAVELALEVRLAEGEPIPADVAPLIEQLTVAA